MSLVLSFGAWGGIYIHRGTKLARLCLGFLAFTLFWSDMDDVLGDALDWWEGV